MSRAEKSGDVRVAAFTGGTRVPSARFRVRQLTDYLRGHGIVLKEYIARLGQYPPQRKILRVPWGAGILAERGLQVLAARDADVMFFQRELVSRFATWERVVRKPRILDVDDAIFVGKGGRAARALARGADCVICGNDYLARWFAQHCDWVEVIPTAVDCARYRPRGDAGPRDVTVLGWIGSRSTLPYLEAMGPILEGLFTRDRALRLTVVCDVEPRFSPIIAERMHFLRWSEDAELAGLAQMDIGLMPQLDDAWGKGKCALKTLQYMAMGIPVVASSGAVVDKIMGGREVGYVVSEMESWADPIRRLAADPATRRGMGENARRLVEAEFAAERIAESLARVIKEVVRKKGRGAGRVAAAQPDRV